MAGGIGLRLNSVSYASTVSTAFDGATFWSIVSAGVIQPDAQGTITDYNLIWDLDGVNYMPQESPTSDALWVAFYVMDAAGSIEISPKNV